MRNKREYHWQDGKVLRLGDNTVVMGILNGTPDSFSDGGKYNTVIGATAHLKEMIASGAGIVDIGFESTRPGHVQISEEEEVERMKEILPALVAESTVPLSIDTYRAKPAAYALSQGITKSYSAMSQAERVALRYSFVLNATKNAQGDFARTSGS